MRRSLSISGHASRACGLALCSLVLAGCASQAYDPPIPRDEPVRVTRLESPLDMEATYRRLFSRLQDCLRATSYHVQPRFDRAAEHAWIMVVSGLGLDRYSFLGNRFAARVDVRAHGAGARVEISIAERELIPVLDASAAWLERDARECRA